MNRNFRYPDDQLREFDVLIKEKLKRAKNELHFYKNQITEIEDKINEEHDGWTDDSMMLSDLDWLYELSQRQKKYIAELEDALIRIANKTYGICQITGKLIDKRRLIAVPTTKKSLIAKIEHGNSPATERD